ncbi:ABC transporter substrate-binding protein [Amycolatopsis suaedae]|uniref:Extracellular solute-binding protein n=1 Tax=Amycolatopsis suaedae TaxID=2510978 RepID=A0A4Q7J2Q1_9PSEU|nr:ABC transporter substrate-binding protein [Amycolatopsis suaedae]RZQ61730.1 extracellular solute-binding protein [Amycolatopsis suaedae]
MRKILPVVVAAAAVLAACGTPTGGENPGANSLPGVDQYFAAPCPEPGVKPVGKQFTYWSMWTADEPQGRVLKKAIDCFTQKTGVQITVQWLGRKVLTQNVAPSLNTDSVPDLIDQDLNQMSAAIMAPGGTQSVQDVFAMKVGEGDKTVRDVLTPGTFELAQNKDKAGQPFLVPYEVLSNAWWYDKSDIPDFVAPKTIDEMFGLFDRIKQSGKGVISQDGDINDYNAYFFTQFAARYVGPGGLAKAASDRSGQSWKSDPGFLEAAKLTERLAKGGYFLSGWDASKFPQVQQRWADGESAFVYNGSWLPSEAREYLGKQGGGQSITFGSFQIPLPQGAKHDIVEQLPIGFSVTAKARNPEPAKAFIAYVLNKDILSGIPAVSNNLTPRADLAVPDDLKEIKAVLDDPNKKPALFKDGIDGMFGGKYVENVFYPASNALLKGTLTAQQFIDQLAAKTAEYWTAQG